MVTLQCTPPLLRFLPVSSSPEAPEPASRLGDWSATLLYLDDRLVVFCLNDRTHLPLLLPLEGAGTFLGRFRQEVLTLVARFSDDPQVIWAETEALLEIQVVALHDQTMLRSMSRFTKFLGDRERLPEELDLEETAQILRRAGGGTIGESPEDSARALMRTLNERKP